MHAVAYVGLALRKTVFPWQLFSGLSFNFPGNINWSRAQPEVYEDVQK